MKITRLIRDNDRVTVSGIGNDGKPFVKYFAKHFTNDQIKNFALGDSAMPVSPAMTETKENADKKLPTIPAPAPGNRQRITRDQMVAAVTTAKINVDINDPAKLKAAYRNLLTRGRDK